MIINIYPGFDLDKFFDANSHLRRCKSFHSDAVVEIVETGSTQDVEQNAAEVSIEDRLTRLERDFYNHSHMRDTGDNPCAGEIILKWPKELRK